MSAAELLREYNDLWDSLPPLVYINELPAVIAEHYLILALDPRNPDYEQTIRRCIEDFHRRYGHRHPRPLTHASIRG